MKDNFLRYNAGNQSRETEFTRNLHVTIKTFSAATAFFASLFASQVSATTLSDVDDSHWMALGPTISFEVLSTNPFSQLNIDGNLDFGLYEVGDPANKTTIFNGTMSTGDTASIMAPSFAQFGFFLTNTSTGFGGPYTFFSDSSLNPINIFTPVAGQDAMIATDLGGGIFELAIEDLLLPIGASIFPSNNAIDITIQVSNLAPDLAPVPLPAGGLLLLTGLAGAFGFHRRTKRRG